MGGNAAQLNAGTAFLISAPSDLGRAKRSNGCRRALGSRQVLGGGFGGEGVDLVGNCPHVGEIRLGFNLPSRANNLRFSFGDGALHQLPDSPAALPTFEHVIESAEDVGPDAVKDADGL